MIDTVLIPAKTIVTAKGDGAPTSVEGASSRTFLITLDITAIVEQEAIELSIFGSTDGQSWDTKPLLTFPQKFYVGQTPMLLHLANQPEIKYLRAHWEVNRWGRGSEEPRFEIGVTLKEVPKEITQAANA